MVVAAFTGNGDCRATSVTSSTLWWAFFSSEQISYARVVLPTPCVPISASFILPPFVGSAFVSSTLSSRRERRQRNAAGVQRVSYSKFLADCFRTARRIKSSVLGRRKRPRASPSLRKEIMRAVLQRVTRARVLVDGNTARENG